LNETLAETYVRFSNEAIILRKALDFAKGTGREGGIAMAARPCGVAPEPPAEAAAEEAEGATTAPAADKGWEGVISRAFIAFSPLALFR
jgi:hypothetical protein